MLTGASFRYGIALVTAMSSAIVGPGLCAQERVGVNSAVNPDATGAPPGSPARRLVIGQPVVFNERITTNAVGQTQVLFLDESAMTIGPNSDITVDQFVYDPNAGVGKLALSATRGVMRFVGGKLSKQEDPVTLRSPVATIAIRGGVFLFDLQANGQADVVFLFGKQLSVTGLNGATQTLIRPGFGVTVAGAGASPSAPYRVPPQMLAQLQGRLDGRAGGNGGASRVPTNETVASSSVSSTISGDVSASVAQATAQTDAQQATQPQAVNVNNLQTNLEINTVQAQGNLQGNSSAIGKFAGGPANFSTSGVNTGGAGVLISYTNNSQFFVTNQGSSTSYPVTNATLGTNGVMSASVSIASGQFPLASGNAAVGPPSATSTVGQLNGNTFLAPDSSFFYAELTTPGGPGQVGYLFGGLPTVNLPTTGQGSYSGSVIGSVLNNGASYVATGAFTNNYNFGTNSGNFAVNNFDNNRSFSGSVNGSSGGYSGQVAGSNLTGSVRGAFYGNAASATGGTFSVTQQGNSLPYAATGVFGGHQ